MCVSAENANQPTGTCGRGGSDALPVGAAAGGRFQQAHSGADMAEALTAFGLLGLALIVWGAVEGVRWMWEKGSAWTQ